MEASRTSHSSPCRSIGLTGGIGSGKSAVRSILSHLGYPCVDADALARSILESPQEAADLAAHLGQDLLTSEGIVDRALLRQHIISNPQQRLRLEEFMHPRIQAHWSEWRNRYLGADLPSGVWLFYEAALLIEKKRGFDFDKIVLVTAQRDLRLERLEGRGLQRNQAEAFANAQLPDAEKIKSADYVLVNDGTLEELRASTFAMLEWLGNEFAASRS